ncbi:hypothetical protein [Streptomyces albospinus]|uniref:hypothetical protein n=1 Tax=Streptomyces albospinus TaxID=285515 RepID=UPI001670B16A|nr:hypothetical protein [Streptomyces albospinus]
MPEGDRSLLDFGLRRDAKIIALANRVVTCYGKRNSAHWPQKIATLGENYAISRACKGFLAGDCARPFSYV